jgi:L-glyceraldehyde 3-phosphate reductase
MLNRWVESELLATLSEEGVGCIAFSPLAQGLLTDKYLDGIPPGSRASKPHGFLKPAQITEEKLDRVRRLHAIARERGQTLASMAIAWVLRNPVVTSALVGSSRPEQIDDAVSALKHTGFTETELASIEAILA